MSSRSRSSSRSFSRNSSRRSLPSSRSRSASSDAPRHPDVNSNNDNQSTSMMGVSQPTTEVIGGHQHRRGKRKKKQRHRDNEKQNNSNNNDVPKDPNAGKGRIVMVNPAGEIQLGQTAEFEEQQQREARERERQQQGQEEMHRQRHQQYQQEQMRQMQQWQHQQQAMNPRNPQQQAIYVQQHRQPGGAVMIVTHTAGPGNRYGPYPQAPGGPQGRGSHGVVYAAPSVFVPGYGQAPVAGPVLTEEQLNQFAEEAERIKKQHTSWLAVVTIFAIAGLIMGIVTEGTMSMIGWIISITFTTFALCITVSMRQKIRLLQSQMLGASYA